MDHSCLLYYITDRKALGADESTRRRRLLEKIHEAAAAGVDYIQLREKDLSPRDLESLAREAVTAIREALPTANRPLSTAFLINSRTDVALAVEADGVHLRSEDVCPHDVVAAWRRCGVGTPARVSPVAPQIAVSCHVPAEVAQAAARGASLAVFGPVFEKKDAAPAGLTVLRQACAAKIPIFAIGGVSLSNTPACLQGGAVGIAAIRLFQENSIAEVVRHLRQDI